MRSLCPEGVNPVFPTKYRMRSLCPEGVNPVFPTKI